MAYNPGASGISGAPDVAMSNVANNNVIMYDGGVAKWKNAPLPGAVDASSTVKGVVQLTGDLGGTAASPTVPGLAGKEPSITPGTTSQFYRGDKSWQTLNKAVVGLANVDNTSDASKPISTPTQTALDLKAPLASPTFTGTVTVPAPASANAAASKSYVDTAVAGASATVSDASTSAKGILQLAGDLGGTATAPTVPGLAGKEPSIASGTTAQYYRGDKTWQTLNKAAVGLANVDNTSDANKPISIATQTALTAKADDTAVVHLSGNETITGTKNFTGTLQAAGQAVVTTTDSRLSNTRIPTDGSVTTAKLNAANSPTNGQLLAYNGTTFAWVASPTAGSFGGFVPSTKTANYTASGSDFILGNAASNGFTVTLPTPVAGAWIKVKKVDSSVNAILVVATGGVLIDDQVSISVNQQWMSYDFLSDGTKWYRV